LWTKGWTYQDATRYTEIGLGPGHIELDGDPAPRRKGAPPLFGSCLLWPNDRMDQDTTYYRGRRRPTRHCVEWAPSFPYGRGQTAQQPPHFRGIQKPRPMSWRNCWMDQDAKWYGGRPWPRRRLGVRWNPAPPTEGAQLVYGVAAILIFPVWTYSRVGRRLSPFLQSLAPDIAFHDRYDLV